MKNINLKIPLTSLESNVKIDRMWWQHSKILPENLLQKIGIPWLWTTLYIIKTQNTSDLTQNVHTYL